MLQCKFMQCCGEVFSLEYLLLFKKSEKITCTRKCKMKATSNDSNRGPLGYRSCLIRINQMVVVVYIGPFYGNRSGGGVFIQFLWAKCLLSSGANLAGVKNQDVLGVLATKVACGVPLAQVLPQRCGCSFFFDLFIRVQGRKCGTLSPTGTPISALLCTHVSGHGRMCP